MTAREAAYRSLIRIEKEGRYSNLETDVTLRAGELPENEGRLYTRLVYGTIERKLTLDYILAPLCVGIPYPKLDLEVRVILRLSAYQLLYADRIPSSAAVNEGVNLCKRYRKSAASMVNAVLRRLCREKEQIVFPEPEADPVLYLSTFYSVSPELCRLFLSDMGFAECVRMLEAVNAQAGVFTTLRVNTLKLSREEFCKRLEERGIPFEKTVLSPTGVRLKGNVTRLEELKEGLCFVQDEASQLAVEALEAQSGQTVLDICSCPGGKSFGAAISMKNRGELRSFDLHGNKLSLVREGAERLGISILQTEEADGRVFLPQWEEKADRILCDLPCSGLGVLSKKPELRYKKEEEISKLPGIQRAILENACRYLKKGGRMVFSTCTVLKRENEALFEGFLRNHPDFEGGELHLPGVPETPAFVTLYPHIHRTDGFFISVLKKKENA